jgi:hypothetical protein
MQTNSEKAIGIILIFQTTILRHLALQGEKVHSKK